MNTNKKPDIIDWKLEDSMTLTTFLHVEIFLKNTGHCLQHTSKSAIGCTHCDSIHLIQMEYSHSARENGCSFSLCLSCFTVDYWEPVVEEVAADDGKLSD